MTTRRFSFRRIQLVYRRSSTMLKCVVLAAVVLSTICLIVLSGAMADTKERTEALRNEAAALEQKNERLEQYIAELGTIQGVQRIAYEKLGLVTPDTIVFQPEN